MHRFVLLIAALVSLAACGPGAVPAADEGAKAYAQIRMDELRDRIRAASDQANNDELSPKEWRAADANLVEIIHDSRFEGLDKSDRGLAWNARAWIAMELKENRNAREYFLVSTKVDPDEAWNWLGLAQADNRVKDYEESGYALLRGLKPDPSRIDHFDWLILRIVDETGTGSRSTLELLRFLVAEPWNSVRWHADGPWERLALEELRAGHRAAAAAAVAKITSPTGVIRVRIDKRFDGLYDRNAPAFDVAKVAQARIAFLERLVKASPDSLRARMELNRELLNTEQFEKTLRLADEVLKAASAGKTFDDMYLLGDIKEQRSNALGKLGHKEEAKAALVEAAATERGDGANVSQMLDLAEVLCDQGDGEDTAQALARTGTNRNAYGESVYHYLAHCAAFLRGDKTGTAKELAYLREHRIDGRFHYLQALLREDRLEEAAQEATSRLESESLRTDMLYELQDFRESDGRTRNEVTRRWNLVFARADVRAAVDRVGRIESFAYGY